MSDSLPKMKLYIFISIIQLLMNMVVVIFTLTSLSGAFNLIRNSAMEGFSSFVPFVSFIGLASLDLDPSFALLMGVFVTLFSAIQTYIIVVIVGGFVSNVIWHPDL